MCTLYLLLSVYKCVNIYIYTYVCVNKYIYIAGWIGVWMNVYVEKSVSEVCSGGSICFSQGLHIHVFSLKKYSFVCVCVHESWGILQECVWTGWYMFQWSWAASVFYGLDSPSLLSWICTTQDVFSSHQVKEESKVTLAHLELASEEKWVPLEYQVWRFSISGWVDINHRGRAQGRTPSCGKRRGWATLRRNRTLIVYWNISQVLEEYLLSQKSQSLMYCFKITRRKDISVSDIKIW